MYISGIRSCNGYVSGPDDCRVVYGYKYTARTGYTLYIKNEKG